MYAFASYPPQGIKVRFNHIGGQELVADLRQSLKAMSKCIAFARLQICEMTTHANAVA